MRISAGNLTACMYRRTIEKWTANESGDFSHLSLFISTRDRDHRCQFLNILRITTYLEKMDDSFQLRTISFTARLLPLLLLHWVTWKTRARYLPCNPLLYLRNNLTIPLYYIINPSRVTFNYISYSFLDDYAPLYRSLSEKLCKQDNR